MIRYYVYVLRSNKDGKLYIEFTTDLKSRLQKHSAGMVASTKNRRYLRLIHYEYFINKTDAKTREVYLKSGGGHDQLKKILKNTLISIRKTC